MTEHMFKKKYKINSKDLALLALKQGKPAPLLSLWKNGVVPKLKTQCQNYIE